MDRGERIAIISPYPQLSELSDKICRSVHLDVDIYTAVLEDGVRIARDLERKNYGSIISRGPTGALIKAAVGIPVILMEITAFDLMETLYRARQVSERIAYFDYRRHEGKFDFYKIREMLNLQHLHVYYYESQEELDSQIKAAKSDGCRIVVASGICIVHKAEAEGLKGEMINTSGGAVLEALSHAQDVVSIRKTDLQLTERLKTIIDHSYSGIIAVDAAGRITHCNPVAQEALRISSEIIVGQNIHDLESEKDLLKLYADGNEALGNILSIVGRKYLVSRVPLKLEAENFGTVITFQEVRQIQSLEATIRKKLYADGLWAKYDFPDIIGSSEPLAAVVKKALKFSKTEATVLLSGESGTGKELFAHSIHKNSLREKGPFMAINCAAIPENLLESELFGYEKGAFTGANKEGNPGLFEIAHGGTLFLDEILSLPLSLQARLLRVLQEKAVRRVGGHKVIPVDVRIVAAANRDIRLAVKEGCFREDLFYRLNVLTLSIPPLRERARDIPALITHFIQKHLKDVGGSVYPLSKKDIGMLIQYSWPGNVRELENFIKKYIILTTNEENPSSVIEELFAELYCYNLEAEGVGTETITIPIGTMKEMEESIIHTLAARSPIDRVALARQIGISRTTLWKKLKC
ncbi:MAG: sigma 54-interacting transcriptional regulator [Clostridiales bacterium]|jgi:transcriptional regulator with PAS, ATPase and Fis domain|nr:sigma 54-interacting transcriptional regulator [Clostridiales bacterium]